MSQMKYDKRADAAGGLILGLLVLWLLFRSLFALPAAVLFIPPFVRCRQGRRQREIIRRRQEEFKNAMSALYSSTASGAPLARALRDTLHEMENSPERFQVLIPEFMRICRELDRNVPMETALLGFAGRSRDENITQFVKVLTIAVRSGGNLPDIIRRSLDAISLKMDMNSEIETMLAGKRAEFRVMVIVPAGILVYMSMTSPEYMDLLYHSGAGHLVMALAGAVYFGALFLGRKILDIRV